MVAVLVIPFLLVNIVVYLYYSAINNNNFIASTTYDFMQISSVVDSCLNKILDTKSFLAMNKKINKFITYPTLENLDQAMVEDISEAIELISTSIISVEYIKDICIYSAVNQYVISRHGGNYINSYNNSVWWQYYQKNPNLNVAILPPDSEEQIGIPIITFVYGIKSNSSNVGIIAFELSTEYINDLAKIGNQYKYNINIIDNNGKLIHQKNKDSEIENNFNFIKQNPEFQEATPVKTGSKTILYSRIGINEALLLTTNYQSGANMLRDMGFIFLICILITLFCTISLSYYMSTQFYRSIESIIANFHEFQSLPQSMGTNADELSYISQSILAMRDKNTTLENNLIEKIAKIKQLQSIALQIQFSPHFLFNTLNGISTMSMSAFGGNNDISKIIHRLSELLRIALNTDEYIVPISSEIEYSKKYVEIESLKNKDNFDAIWEISHEVSNCCTIKLSLQPLIENAFQHGIKYLRNEKRGYLKINADCTDDNTICLSISNNGSVITPKKLEQIQIDLEENDMPSPKHIGLCNVNRRIKLIFGEQYGIKIIHENELTTVSITIPKIPYAY